MNNITFIQLRVKGRSMRVANQPTNQLPPIWLYSLMATVAAAVQMANNQATVERKTNPRGWWKIVK